MEQFARESVEIEPGTIEMLSPIELTQYYIQVQITRSERSIKFAFI